MEDRSPETLARLHVHPKRGKRGERGRAVDRVS
jgi:hypothetical protein